jgi:hypothetical protein
MSKGAIILAGSQLSMASLIGGSAVFVRYLNKASIAYLKESG